MILSDLGAQIQNLESTTNRRPKRSRTAGGVARRSGTAVETRLWPHFRGHIGMQPHFRGRTGMAALALWARVCPPGPLSPGAYKYPLGVLQMEIQRVRMLEC